MNNEINKEGLTRVTGTNMASITRDTVLYCFYTTHQNRTHAQKWRVTSIKRWKRDQSRIEIGLKHGLHSYYKLTNLNVVGSEVYM
jgi:hypothetical protein